MGKPAQHLPYTFVCVSIDFKNALRLSMANFYGLVAVMPDRYGYAHKDAVVHVGMGKLHGARAGRMNLPP